MVRACWRARRSSTMSANAMGELVCRPMKTAVGAFSNDVDFIDGMQWGLSFLINPQPMPTGRSAGSLAWAGLANSYYWIDPVKQVTGVYATQVLPFFDAKAVRPARGFRNRGLSRAVTHGLQRRLINTKCRK